MNNFIIKVCFNYALSVAAENLIRKRTVTFSKKNEELAFLFLTTIIPKSLSDTPK